MKERSCSKAKVILAKEIAKYLTENMNRRVTLEELSNQFHMSGTHIKNSFKEVYGVSYYQYIRVQKMQAAAYMLVDVNFANPKLFAYSMKIRSPKLIAEFAAGKNAIVGLCTSGSFNVLGNDGRCSIIGVEIGFENIGVDANIDTSSHGNEASFEFIVEKNPEYIFVMDRDAAIQAEGAKLAKEIMENELVMSTDAYKNGNIIYLAHPAVWYTAEGGVTALDYMLSDLESELLK